jgi:hypothetical protein
MATKVYEENKIHLIDDTEIIVSPCKIKYLHELMETFTMVNHTTSDEEAILIMVECARIAMKQFYPSISGSVEDIEDNMDLPNVYKILDYCAGIKIDEKKEDTVKEQATGGGTTWAELDLLKLESEVFLLGAWKNYDDLELSLSMPELLTTISTRRELDHNEKKFLAAIQGVDIDKDKDKGEDAWQAMKDRVFNKGKKSNDMEGLRHLGMGYEEVIG